MTEQNMETIKTTELLIIGSGPAGLTAALYAGRANLSPVVIAGQTPGGQLTTTSEVENFPGFPEGIDGPTLMEKMLEQAKRFGSEIINEAVVDFQIIKSGEKNTFQVSTQTQTFSAKAVIVAVGAEANWLGLASEQRLRGKGVSACATCDGFFFKNKKVVVIGGGDSAMEEANFLTKFAESVTLIHRKDTFKASKIMLDRAKSNPKITFITNAEVVEVLGEDKVSGVKIQDTITGKTTQLECAGYFAAIGHTPATKLFQTAGVETDAKGYIVTKNFTETNITGLFVAGDAHDHRYRQAVTAAGEGCKAALDAEKYLSDN